MLYTEIWIPQQPIKKKVKHEKKKIPPNICSLICECGSEGRNPYNIWFIFWEQQWLINSFWNLLTFKGRIIHKIRAHDEDIQGLDWSSETPEIFKDTVDSEQGNLLKGNFF